MPSEIASWPLAESTSTFGMKYGETRSGPRSRRVSACSTIPISPPIAEPKTIPTRCGSRPFSPESAIASFAAPSARTTLRSSRRSSFGGASPAGSKPLTSAATRTGNPSASKARIQSMPLSPATAARHVSGAVFPTGVTAPSPVTTTRLTRWSLERSGGDALLLQRKLRELVPVGLDLFREGLLVRAVLARDVGRLGVAGALGDALEQLVRGDLEVLGRVAVAGVPPGLLLANQVDDALHQCAHHPGRLAHHRRRSAPGFEPVLESVGVLLRLELVVAQL